MKPRNTKSWMMLVFGLILHGSAVVLLIMFINGTGPFEKKPEVAKNDKDDKDTPNSINPPKPNPKPRPRPDPKPQPDPEPAMTKFIASASARRAMIAIDILFENAEATNNNDMTVRLTEVAERMLLTFVEVTLNSRRLPDIVVPIGEFASLDLVPLFVVTKHIIVPLGETGRLFGRQFVVRGEALKQAQMEADEKLKRYRVRYTSPQACKDAVGKLREEAKNEKDSSVRYLLELEAAFLLARQGIIDDAVQGLDAVHEQYHINYADMTVRLFNALNNAYSEGTRRLLLPALRKAIVRLTESNQSTVREKVRLLEMGRDICFGDLRIATATRQEFQDDLMRVAFPHGKKLCFDLGNWKEGLPFLAHCEDAILKKIVLQELRSPTDLMAFIPLAREWTAWCKTAKLSPQRQIVIYLRAIHWYDRFLEAKVDSPDVPAAKFEKSRLEREIQFIENLQSVLAFAVYWSSAR